MDKATHLAELQEAGALEGLHTGDNGELGELPSVHGARRVTIEVSRQTVEDARMLAKLGGASDFRDVLGALAASGVAADLERIKHVLMGTEVPF